MSDAEDADEVVAYRRELAQVRRELAEARHALAARERTLERVLAERDALEVDRDALHELADMLGDLLGSSMRALEETCEQLDAARQATARRRASRDVDRPYLARVLRADGFGEAEIARRLRDA